MIKEKKEFKVSVVIPTYNRVAYLGRAINSVLKQSYPVNEIIVIDNGSTDKTLSFIKKKFTRIRVITEKKRGVSFARNLGIKNCKYNWIAFLDSDDEWTTDKIEKQFVLLKESNFKYQFIHTNEIWIKNGMLKNQKKKHLKKGGYIFEDCLDICKISPSSVLIKKELFDRYGLFDNKFKVCEDYELWLRIASKIKIGYLDKPLIKKYGGHKGQLSEKYWGVDRYRIKALEKVLINNNLKKQQKLKVLEYLLNKINIILLGAINRNNKRIFNMYIKKKFLWLNYNYNVKNKNN
jgi:glycosyltransferase involved in cell wall biosynthesis